MTLARVDRSGEERVADPDELDGMLGDPDPSGRLSFWPPSFRFHPWSGKTLIAGGSLRPSRGNAWSPSGLAEIPTLSLQNASERVACELPGAAKWFAVGGTPARLVALDPQEGRAWWQRPRRGDWQSMGIVEASSLPPWSGGALGTGDGVAYSSTDGVVWLMHDRPDEPTVSKVDGALVALGALYDDDLSAWPVLRDGGVTIAGGYGPALQSLASTTANVDSMLSAPVGNGTDTAIWVGRHGYLVHQYRRGRAEQHIVQWRTWPEGVEGLPHLKPWRASGTGRLYAFGKGAGGRAVSISMPIAGSPEIRELDGPHAAAGTTTWRGTSCYQDPSDHEGVEPPLGPLSIGRWLLPIVSLAGGQTIVAAIDDPASARAFLFREEAAQRRYDAVLHLYDGLSFQPLDFITKIRSSDDLVWFVDEGVFNLVNTSLGEGAGWRIR